MPELASKYSRSQKYIFYLLSLYVLGWGFTSYQSIFLGLILGTSMSLFNLWILYRKIDRFGNAVVKGEKVRTLGMLQRMAAAVLAVAIAMRFPENIHLMSVILGLMTSYIVIMIDSFVQLFKGYK